MTNLPLLVLRKRLVLYMISNPVERVVKRCYCPRDEQEDIYLIIAHYNDSNEQVEFALPTYELAEQWLEYNDTERFRDKWYGYGENSNTYWYIKRVTMMNILHICNKKIQECY